MFILCPLLAKQSVWVSSVNVTPPGVEHYHCHPHYFINEETDEERSTYSPSLPLSSLDSVSVVGAHGDIFIH